MDEVKVRTLPRACYSQMMAIDRSLFSNYLTPQDLDKFAGWFYGAWVGEELVGFCGLQSVNQGRRYWLYRLGVDCAYQRMGVGRAMVERLDSVLQKSRRQWIGHMVWERDKESLGFLSAVGFRSCKLHRGAVEVNGKVDDLIEMRLHRYREENRVSQFGPLVWGLQK